MWDFSFWSWMVVLLLWRTMRQLDRRWHMIRILHTSRRNRALFYFDFFTSIRFIVVRLPPTDDSCESHAQKRHYDSSSIDFFATSHASNPITSHTLTFNFSVSLVVVGGVYKKMYLCFCRWRGCYRCCWKMIKSKTYIYVR